MQDAEGIGTIVRQTLFGDSHNLRAFLSLGRNIFLIILKRIALCKGAYRQGRLWIPTHESIYRLLHMYIFAQAAKPIVMCLVIVQTTHLN